MSKKTDYYLSYLDMNYGQAVKKLLDKYGKSTDDYFREKSYNKFLNGEIKSIAKGKFTRTSEGLYCHHIDENKYMNLSNKPFIKDQKPPFSTQKKDRLIYCDLIEHFMLHALITKETNHEYGEYGLDLFLRPLISEWYINGLIPKPKWMKNCYDKAYIEISEAKEIIEKTDNFLK